MPAIKPSLNTDYLVHRHRAGATCQQIACEHGVSLHIIIKILRSVGIDTSRRKIPVDMSQALPLYYAGIGVAGIAMKMGVSRMVMVRAFGDAGIKTRNRSEQQSARMAATSPEQRKKLAQAAHDAIRGRPAKIERLELAAKTREKTGNIEKSVYEIMLTDMLNARGISVTPQKAFGIYNCDIAADPVAVEVAGGHWHWHGHHLARTQKRFNYIMNSGWHVLMIAVNASSPMTESVADYVASYIQAARSNPTAPREYRVIWRAGEFSTSGCLNDDNFSIKPPFTITRDIVNGRYKSVAS